LRIQDNAEGFVSDHYVKYGGRGIGHETVYVDGIPVSSSISLFWFTPRFEFSVGGQKAVLKVRISPWLTVQSLQLFIGDSLEYAEGGNPIGTDRLYIGMSLLAFLGIVALLYVGLTTILKLILPIILSSAMK
jgi:hypothetical protein